MVKPYLMFNGKCEEAFRLYQRAFDGELVAIQKYGEMPPNPQFPVSEGEKDFVLHAELRLTENGFIMGADGETAATGANISISVEMSKVEDAKSAWHILREGGLVVMELAPTFFAKLHGTVMDKYGFTWMISVM